MLALVVASVALGQESIVLGDVVVMRAKPSLDAQEQARLRINTPVRIRETTPDGHWHRVAMAHRPTESPVEGWIAAHLVGPTPITEAHARQASEVAYQAGQRAEAVRWAQRAYALDISDDAAKERVERLTRRRFPERTSFTVAVCDGTRVSLIGHYDIHDGWIVPDPAYWGGAGTLPWFVGDTQRAEPVVGTPFVRPFTTSRQEPEPWRAYGPADGCVDDCVLRLGACTQDGAVYATIGLTPSSEPRLLSLEDQLRGSQAWAIPPHLRRLPPEPPKPAPSLSPPGSANPRWFEVDLGTHGDRLGVFDAPQASRSRRVHLKMVGRDGQSRELVVDYE